MKILVARLIAAVSLLLLVHAPSRAQVVEEATASTIPWSGWWWPTKTGELALGYRRAPSPLGKHDQVTGTNAIQWETTHRYHYDPQGADWWGHCHAWAAASVLEPEPLHDVLWQGVPFVVGDIKGLLTEAHYSDRVVSYGKRFDGNPGDDFQDMYPQMVWSVLRQYLFVNKSPVVLDINPGVQIWSYPVYKYRLTYQPIGAAAYNSAAVVASRVELRPGIWAQAAGNSSYQGHLTVWLASFQVAPDFLGTATLQHDYTFVFQARGGQAVPGSDHWTLASLPDHPDFAWYPTQRAQENPALDYKLVSKLGRFARD